MRNQHRAGVQTDDLATKGSVVPDDSATHTYTRYIASYTGAPSVPGASGCRALGSRAIAKGSQGGLLEGSPGLENGTQRDLPSKDTLPNVGDSSVRASAEVVAQHGRAI